MPKTILVTGGAGFVGSHLCERLVQDGHTVISLDNYFTGSVENHVPGVTYREGHTKDIETLIPETPDTIYHLGEYSRAEKSFEEPALVWDLNIVGTLGVLEFCRSRNVKKLVYAGSSTKFATGGVGKNQSPYAWSKATNTELVQNYAEWFGMKYAIAYFYNVYGPRERAGAYGTVIEIFHQAFKEGKVLSVVSPGTQTRNFTHVADVVEGLILVEEKGEGDGYGLGDEQAHTIIDIAHMFTSKVEMLPERAGNRLGSAIDVTKTKILGWSASRHVEDYIREIVE